MTLFIILDQTPSPKYSHEDIILTNVRERYSDCKCLVINISYERVNEDVELISQVNQLFDTLPEVYSDLRNTYHSRLFRPLYSLLAQIDEQLAKGVTEIVLFGGSTFPFIALNKAEGEGNKILYNSAWLFNYFIYRRYNESLGIRWINRTPKIYLKALLFVRETLFTLNFFISFIKEYLFLDRKVSKDYPTSALLGIVNSTGQYLYLTSIMKARCPDADIQYVTTSSNLAISSKFEGIYLIRKCSIPTVFKIWCSIRRYRNPKRTVSCIGHLALFDSCTSQLITAGGLHLLKKEVNRLALEEYLVDRLPKTQNQVLISAMTYNEKIAMLHSVARKIKVRHINFQPATMERVLYPQLKLADLYLMYSKKTFELYRQYSLSFHYYLPLKDTGDFKSQNIVTIFTQPDAYTEKYLRLLKSLLPEISKKFPYWKVRIKLHYRQDRIPEFHSLRVIFPSLEVMQNDISVQDAIQSSRLVISIRSSVLFEAAMIGRLAVMCVEKDDETAVRNDDNCCPEVNFIVESPSGVCEIISRIHEYESLYIERRSIWTRNSNELSLKEMCFA